MTVMLWFVEPLLKRWERSAISRLSQALFGP
jgi:hypothetical protein